MGFIGPAEAVPLLQSLFCLCPDEFFATCKVDQVVRLSAGFRGGAGIGTAPLVVWLN